MEVYELIAEDLTHLGGPMGSEYTIPITLGLFSTAVLAKQCAVAHYHGKQELKWNDDGNGKLNTQDLGYVMYHIVQRKIID